MGIAAIIAAGGALMLSVLPAAAARPVQFYAQQGDGCLGGQAPNLAQLTILWKDASDELKGRATVKADDDGYWWTCFDVMLEPGDTIKITKGTSSRTVTIPRITAVANRVTNIVRGRGPAGASLELGVWGDDDWTEAQETVPGDGRYQHDFTGDFDLVGCNEVQVTWTSDAGDQVSRSIGVPCIEVVVGRVLGWDAQITGYTRVLGRAEVELRDASDVLKGRAHDGGSAWSGSIHTYFGEDDDGDLVRALPGDKVQTTGIASDASFTIPAITIATNLATDVVSGVCLPDRPYQISAWSENHRREASRSGVAGGAGQFSKDLTSDMNLKAGDFVEVACRFVTGDYVSRIAVAK